MLKNEDKDDEAMPDLEDFNIPDMPRPLPQIEVGSDAFQITRPNGCKESISISKKELKALQKKRNKEDTKNNKRKLETMAPLENMSITQARNEHQTILVRKDGKLVQPASQRISDLIQSHHRGPRITNDQRNKISANARKEVLDRVGIRDEKSGELRFPDPQNESDQIKLSQQRGITTWIPSPSISIEGCFRFRDHAHRGLPKATTRVPIVGSHFDQQTKEWGGSLRSIVAALPLLNIPISTPVILPWLIDKHWPIVSDSLDIICCYICALRLLIGGMDVGEKVLNKKTDKLFIHEDRQAEIINQASAAIHNPLWSFEDQTKVAEQRKKLAKHRYPAWFDLGQGQTPSVKRNKKLSDDDLEKIMVQCAMRNKTALKDLSLVKLNAGLTILEKNVLKCKISQKSNATMNLPLMRQFYSRTYALSELATHELIAAYELTLLWVIQRYVPLPLLNNLSKIRRKVLHPPFPVAFSEYILKRRITLFQARSYLGGIIPCERFKPGQEKYEQSLIRAKEPTFPTMQEMHSFYMFLQIKTDGQADLIQRLSDLRLATKNDDQQQQN